MKSILVARLSSMGDVILAASIFDFLKSRFPGVIIHFLTSKRYNRLFCDDMRLASVICVEHCEKELDALSAAGIDMVLDLQNSRRSRRIISSYFNSKIIHRLNKFHAARAVLLLFRINFYPPKNSITGRYIRTVDPCCENADSIFPPRLYFGGSTETETFFSCFGQKPVLAIMPFSAWKNKQWSLDFCAATARHFVGKGWGIAVLGGALEESEAGRLAGQIGDSAVSLAGKMDLYETGCFLKHCSLALGVDTGLSHLARACNVKTGIVYGPTTRHFGFYPYGLPAFKIFESKEFCRPCHAHGGDFCLRLNHSCMKSVRPKEVIKGLEELLNAVTP